MNPLKRFLLIGILALSACASNQQMGKNDYVAVAQVTNTSLVQAIGVGAASGKLKKADANNLLKQVDVAQEGIDVANNSLTGVDAQDKLKASQQVFHGIVEYLTKKGVAVK